MKSTQDEEHLKEMDVLTETLKIALHLILVSRAHSACLISFLLSSYFRVYLKEQSSNLVCFSLIAPEEGGYI